MGESRSSKDESYRLMGKMEYSSQGKKGMMHKMPSGKMMKDSEMKKMMKSKKK